jgi:pimeloyl-ACP methyl ester carboxylesterase
MQFDFESLHGKLPRGTKILSIHGELDRVVPLSSRHELLRLLPQARTVGIGDHPAQIPNEQFGHHWWEYFDIQIWQDVVNEFLRDGSKKAMSHL